MSGLVPLHTFLGSHGYFWADLPSRTGFRPEQQLRPGQKYCSVQRIRPKIPALPRYMVSGVSGTGNPHIKLVLA